MILSRRFNLPRIALGIPEVFAFSVTAFGIVAFMLHADSPPSAWCWVHIIPLPFLGWFIGGLPPSLLLPLALAQLLGGFVCWSVVYRIIRHSYVAHKRHVA